MIKARRLIVTSFSLCILQLASGSEVFAATSVPLAPTSVKTTSQDASVVVSWSAPSNGGSPITGYTVTSTPGSKSCTTTGATSCTVTGLTNGTAYTFTVTASNIVGSAPSSLASPQVTPSTVPQAVATITGHSFAAVWSCSYGPCNYTYNVLDITVKFGLYSGGDGGSPITGYDMVCPNGSVLSGPWGNVTWQCRVTRGTNFTISIYTINANGRSAAAATLTAIWNNNTGYAVTYS